MNYYKLEYDRAMVGVLEHVVLVLGCKENQYKVLQCRRDGEYVSTGDQWQPWLESDMHLAGNTIWEDRPGSPYENILFDPIDEEEYILLCL